MRKVLTILTIYMLFYGVGMLYFANDSGIFDQYAYLLDDYEWVFEVIGRLP